jgi:hypothetical protein
MRKAREDLERPFNYQYMDPDVCQLIRAGLFLKGGSVRWECVCIVTENTLQVKENPNKAIASSKKEVKI